ncbi:hypothetical protein LR013_05235 [candidate division NPL-UPA2 bacterium]|nr:hypothetical protein [candidate division NPL-UPA2 bacterium]
MIISSELERVVYGTSDHLLNFGEVLLSLWAAEAVERKPLFFNYPKGPGWASEEVRLFEPYEPPSWRAEEALRDAGLPALEVIPLQQMVEGELGNLTLGEIAKLIRSEREIKSFRAVNLLDAKPVYVSSKNKAWRHFWADRPLKEVLNDPQAKIGGAFIYFLYEAWLARHPDCLGILPGKQRADVLGAFKAGQLWASGQAQVLPTGEFDFMTHRQWEEWEVRGRRGWRKVPAFAVHHLLTSPDQEWVKRRLLVEQLYTPLAYDEETDRFFLWK